MRKKTKTHIFMNKPVYLGLLILEIKKILMYEFWYDFLKPIFNKKVKLLYMDTNSFFKYVKTNDIYKGTAEVVKTRFNTSNYELECSSIDRPLLKGKSKKVIGLMKDELGGRIKTKKL